MKRRFICLLLLLMMALSAVLPNALATKAESFETNTDGLDNAQENTKDNLALEKKRAGKKKPAALYDYVEILREED